MARLRSHFGALLSVPPGLAGVRERRRADGVEINYMDSSAGKSGGQKAKLAFTILSAALLAQYGLADDPHRADSLRLVVVDEVFASTDEPNSRRAMELFKRMGFQLLLAAPWKAEARIAESYVDSTLRSIRTTMPRASSARAARNTSPCADNSMFSRAELLAQARRRYPDFLRTNVTGEGCFPLELRLGKTRRAADYPGYQAELAALREAATDFGFQIEWESVRAPRFGQHDRPQRAFFAGEPEYLRALGKAGEAQAFREDVAAIRAASPALEPWLARNDLKIVAQHKFWPRLLRVVMRFERHPRCGLYMRQLPISGIDTKFLENHSAILDELLTAAHPVQVTLKETRFAARHGLRREDPLMRLRFLDPALQAARGFPVDDLSVPVTAFRRLPLSGVRVLITENLRTFLALPALDGTVAIDGGGNALSLLASSAWLSDSPLFYWGDIDAHGFLMLNRLRESFPHTVSIMMDAAALAAVPELTGNATPVGTEEVPLLTTDEALLFARLRDGSVGLEQERLPWDYVVTRLGFAIVGS